MLIFLTCLYFGSWLILYQFEPTFMLLLIFAQFIQFTTIFENTKYCDILNLDDARLIVGANIIMNTLFILLSPHLYLSLILIISLILTEYLLLHSIAHDPDC